MSEGTKGCIGEGKPSKNYPSCQNVSTAGVSSNNDDDDGSDHKRGRLTSQEEENQHHRHSFREETPDAGACAHSVSPFNGQALAYKKSTGKHSAANLQGRSGNDSATRGAVAVAGSTTRAVRASGGRPPAKNRRSLVNKISDGTLKQQEQRAAARTMHYRQTDVTRRSTHETSNDEGQRRSNRASSISNSGPTLVSSHGSLQESLGGSGGVGSNRSLHHNNNSPATRRQSSTTNLSTAREGGEVFQPEQSQATAIMEHGTLGNPERSPVSFMGSEEINSYTDSQCWRISRKKAIVICAVLVIFFVTIFVVVWLPSSSGGRQEPDGDNATCGDVEQIPDIWGRCLPIDVGATARGVPSSCQEEKRAALSVILSDFLPDGLKIDSCDATNMALLSMAETSPEIESTGDELTRKLLIAERFALTCLYFSTGGNEWIETALWLSIESHCIWYGVTCDDSERVVEIDLTLNNLRGTIPSELAILSHLKFLKIEDGALEGTIPSEVFRSLSELEYLVLRYNSLKEISTEIGSLGSLKEVDFTSNDLGGTTLPTEVGLLSDLESFACHTCFLEGRIPTEFGECTRLMGIQLDTNFLGGSLPTEIGQLTSLLHLNLDTNAFESELIPSAVFRLTQLTTLALGVNSFGGPALPSDLLLNLTNLRTLNFRHMTLSGPLPTTELALLAPTIEILDLEGNFVSGTIPTEIGTLTHLTSLHLPNNDLTGFVPSELGLLTNLASLWLTDNFVDLVNIPPEVEQLIRENEIAISPCV